MGMHNPPHPAEILREDVLPELDITITDFAKALGYSRVQLSKLLNGHASITSDLAVRLERAGIGRARHWLAMQAAYELWHAEQRAQPKVPRLYDAHIAA
ncbi:HigA family addiction module antitoxin [Pseudomonas aeruginosa]|uniref:HigA family addiction module antitoxin n=1 Tax=Pseudomonas aeruginosa TaxID=287 RepID=UPI0029505775|nr:HigA family addiction module antidote protein [Pseudomonas aeruginosa]EKW6550010.1 HigA family addiction module antidote protein [Pseudomonas aeruginosa]EKX9015125.1 HigA family addiction module antidote protein [Pseudomonas aeruginosa]EKY0764169.1 HigA family addiction module antidote protein [Pseudomonas aeruginosa]ELY0898734.1 HigA family addiction module antidote protein [Pseudomonas aeruginosa]